MLVSINRSCRAEFSKWDATVLIMHSGADNREHTQICETHPLEKFRSAIFPIKRVKYNPFIRLLTRERRNAMVQKESLYEKILAFYFWCDDTWIFHSCGPFTELLMNFYKFVIKRRSETGSNAGRCHRAIANLIGGSRWQRCIFLPSEQSLRPWSAAGATPRPR